MTQKEKDERNIPDQTGIDREIENFDEVMSNFKKALLHGALQTGKYASFIPFANAALWYLQHPSAQYVSKPDTFEMFLGALCYGSICTLESLINSINQKKGE